MRVLAVQPSSAAVERVFSLLKGSFSCKQTSALEDYIECSVMTHLVNSIVYTDAIATANIYHKYLFQRET